jgi:DNA repair exonuclease SbcCD ATPase subunit
MIILKTLSWGNCFSYGDNNVLQLNNNTITQIAGTNGAGKSSIPLILEEVLFNKNSKGYKKSSIPNRYLNKGYWIDLTFTKDDDDYEIRTNRQSSLKVSFLKNGEDISSHTSTNTYKSISEVIGKDFNTFSQLIYQHPDSSLAFLKATDTNRKKFLIELLNLDEYVKIFEIFKEAARDCNKTVIELNSRVNTIEKWIEENNSTDATVLPLLKLDIDTSDDEKKLASLSKELENIFENNQKIVKNNEYKKLLKQIDTREFAQSLSLKSADDLLSEQGKNQALINTLTGFYKKISKLEDHCPTCEQEISVEFKDKLITDTITELETIKSRQETLNEQIKDTERNNREFRRIRKLQEDWESIARSIRLDIPKNIVDEQELRGRISSVRKRLSDAEVAITKIQDENRRRTSHNAKIEVREEQLKKLKKELKSASRLLSAEEQLLANLEILKKAFSTNGLLAYKIENLVKELEELTNSYLLELADGRFTLEFVIVNDKLNVVIIDDGRNIEITELSSGELARVNTATLLAIRRLMSSISESRINVLFLDEVINVLDEYGREKLVEILLKETELNTYIVSHGWTHPLLSTLNVVKNNNISVLSGDFYG